MRKPLNVRKQHIASFDIDAQNTFTPVCPHELPVPEGDEIADELNAQAQFATLRVGSKDAHSRDAVWVAKTLKEQGTSIKGENVDVRWVKHAVPGTKGFELMEGLPAITDYHYFVWKGIELDMHPYGACYHDFDEHMSTGVIEFLKSHHITTIIAGGLATDYCVKRTVLQLLAAGFQVIVNLGACRGIALESTEAAINEMREAGALFVASGSDIEG